MGKLVEVICFWCKGSGKNTRKDGNCPFCLGCGYEKLTIEQSQAEALRQQINNDRRH